MHQKNGSTELYLWWWVIISVLLLQVVFVDVVLLVLGLTCGGRGLLMVAVRASPASFDSAVALLIDRSSLSDEEDVCRSLIEIRTMCWRTLRAIPERIDAGIFIMWMLVLRCWLPAKHCLQLAKPNRSVATRQSINLYQLQSLSICNANALTYDSYVLPLASLVTYLLFMYVCMIVSLLSSACRVSLSSSAWCMIDNYSFLANKNSVDRLPRVLPCFCVEKKILSKVQFQICQEWDGSYRDALLTYLAVTS